MSSRAFTSVEIAAGVAIVGSLLGVAVPAFIRNLHASHLTEATAGLAKLQTRVLGVVETTGVAPAPAPLTPAVVARGARSVDAPGTWEHPTWRQLEFAPVPDGIAHAYSFSLEHDGADVVARARGDLDGDGVTSLFEARVRTDGKAARLLPGLYVEAELE
ncbi:MAG: hypothetical protein IPG50_01215 [Myxococcales bacterium]|nr:hypothetical protein [Myxococcales bacterium]